MARWSRRRERLRDDSDEFREAIPATRRPVDGPVLRRTEEVVEPATAMGTAAGIVYWVTAAIEVLLLFRLLLRVGGANDTNGFVNLVYNLTAPLVAPFFGVFNIDITSTSVGAFEFATVIAMVVYAVIGYLIARLLSAVQGYDN